MRILNIPAYAKFVGSDRTYQVKISYILSTALFNAFHDMEETSELYRYENLPLNTNVPEFMNNLLTEIAGEPTAVLTDDLHMYQPVKIGDTINTRLFNYGRYLGLNIDYFYGMENVANFNALESLTSLNSFEFYDPDYWYEHGYNPTAMTAGALAADTRCNLTISNTPDKDNCLGYFTILPEDIFDSDGKLDVDGYIEAGLDPIQLQFQILATEGHFEVGIPVQYVDHNLFITLGFSYYQNYWSRIKTQWGQFSLEQSAAQLDDPTDPYNMGGSWFGGGDGNIPAGGIDNIDPALVPNIPGISAANLGFITMYNPTAAQIKSLSDYLWSNAFDLATYKKLFSDPMQSIIGLAIVPVAPTIAGSKNVHFGTIDSGINMSYLSTNYVQLDCGSVELYKYVGCFMDNDPYTKIQIYLPFIGFRQLSADDLIGGSIHVVYNVDVLTGACAAFIEHSTRGVLYSYNGSCITNIPLTAVNFSGAIQNAVTAIGSMVGMAAGMATGTAPLTAMSAVGMMTSAANTALNSKQQVQRSGNLGGSAGILSILTPYVVIERPNMSVPSNIGHYTGQTCNVTMNLGTCHGFTMCEYVHLDGVSATSEEILEIESLLKAGVML